MREENFNSNSGINEKLMIEIREYIKAKTGKFYFSSIRRTENNLIVTCPFHKEGQERKPSCNIRITPDKHSSVGTVHCFTCGETMSISEMMIRILGSFYNAEEVEARFHLSSLSAYEYIAKEKESIIEFEIPERKSNLENILRTYRFYHPYLEKRRISKEIAQLYDIGYDKYNNQITFPLRDISKKCLGIGRRSIDLKRYEYPKGMIKPLYGVYELSQFLNFIWIVEGPFNLWSLKGWNKEGLALLGTGTDHQYRELLKIKCDKYVLALDPDDAGRSGIYKLGNFLKSYKKTVYVALLPDGKDINDLIYDEFVTLPVIPYSDWLAWYKSNNKL